jgi:hypothetical protein
MDNRKKTVLEALELHNGIISSACSATNTPRSTFYLWLKEDAEFKAAVDDIQEVAIDYVESKLFEKIEGIQVVGKGARTENDEPPTYQVPPSDTAIIFYLKTKGKKRGYVERTEQEHSGSGGGPIQNEIKHVVEFHDFSGDKTEV